MAPQIGPKEKAFVLSFYLSLSLSLSQSQRAKLTAAALLRDFNHEISPRQVINIVKAAGEKRKEDKENWTSTPYAIQAFKEQVQAIIEDPRTPRSQISCRKIAAQLPVSHETVRKIMREELCLKPYKPQKVQKLTDANKAARLLACLKFLQQDPDFWKNCWFSDEAHFSLNGSVNKQNDRWWASENPQHYVEQVAHPQRVTVFAAIHPSKGIVFCFMEGIIDSTAYINAMEDEIIPQIYAKSTSETDFDVFMQDGAGPHVSHQTMAFLQDDPCFAALVSKNADTSSGSLEWPPYSPDLNPCDAFLWGYLKSRVWANGPIATLTELKKRITEEINLLDTTDREKISNGCNAFLSNVRACVDAEGGHFC